MNNQTQTLLQECLVSTGHVECCAIFRRKDILLRANSNGFTLSIQEMEDLSNTFSNLSETHSRGILLKDTNYKVIRADKYSIYGKKGKEGLVMIRTSILIILALYSADMYPSIVVEAVEKLGDYLREKGK
ncbi:profilin-4-like [Clytia hemisphaerica]|uniref:Profilin n=1 Tax=Clytia hemisphaerica TaxID=252671 RepID=A0A7M5VBI0_9CNID